MSNSERVGAIQMASHQLPEMLETLRHVLRETQRRDSLELLEKAVSKSLVDHDYAVAMEETILRRSTVALRELLSVFGDYFGPPRSEFPFYPHHDAVNGIDSALGAIKYGSRNPGALQEYIDFIKVLRS